MVGLTMRAAATLLVAMTSGRSMSGAHPLHTTLMDITVDASRNTMRAVVRIFADDIALVLSKRAGRTAAAVPTDAEASEYVLTHFAVVDASSTAIPSRACGVRRSGDLLWVCVEAGVDRRSVKIKDAVLCELYADQVNIVQISGTGESRSLLFTRGDGAKTLF